MESWLLYCLMVFCLEEQRSYTSENTLLKIKTTLMLLSDCLPIFSTEPVFLPAFWYSKNAVKILMIFCLLTQVTIMKKSKPRIYSEMSILIRSLILTGTEQRLKNTAI